MEKVRPITNPQNNFVRFIKSLKKKKKRLEEGKFLLEGINSVEEALKSGIEIPYFIYSLDLFRVKGGQELFDTLEKNGSRLILVAEKIFNKLADTQNPQGILAVPSRIDWDASELYSLECSFVLVLDGIQDPGNMGTIVRLA
ncbi:MAG: TrmH family RNA methyltransferase, partial [Candidatus Muiribacteriaceae bacterium]